MSQATYSCAVGAKVDTQSGSDTVPSICLYLATDTFMAFKGCLRSTFKSKELLKNLRFPNLSLPSGVEEFETSRIGLITCEYKSLLQPIELRSITFTHLRPSLVSK
jgi:hypothetical protein